MRYTMKQKTSTRRQHGKVASSFLLMTTMVMLDPNSSARAALAFSPPSILHRQYNPLISKGLFPFTKGGSSARNNHSTTLNMLSIPTIKSAAVLSATKPLSTKSITAFLAPPLLLTNLHLTLSALTATITGGIFAGSLHAIAGPDHLAALLPRCCGLPWYKAGRIGAVWGLGHGVSATLLGMVGFALKRGVSFFGFGGNGSNFDMLHHAGSFMELAIGVSLIVIGLIGVKEAREWNADDVALEAAVAEEGASSPSTAKSAVLFNGILHGFSWDGAPSLAPAVAIASWRGSLTFLVSYALGTMAAMTLATTVIGEGTRRASKKLDRPDLPRDLSVGSSFLALLVGVVWCVLALR